MMSLFVCRAKKRDVKDCAEGGGAEAGQAYEADNEAVLGAVVLVLVLDHEALTCMVVSLALATAAELSLEALEVRLVLDDLDEDHFESGNTMAA
jgi:hypothetical protein